MQLQATITVDVFAGDLSEAAEHQRRLEEVLNALRATYPDAELLLTERRRKARATEARPVSRRDITGRVNRYPDVGRL